MSILVHLAGRLRRLQGIASRVIVGGIVAVTMTAGTATPSYAQSGGIVGFFQSIFSGPKQPAYQPPPAPPATVFPGQGVSPGTVLPPNGEGAQAAAAPRSGLGGGWRTMCVRLCDGYYWPVRYNASRARFGHDSKLCESSCTSEARLFYMPARGDARDMVDLAGRSYAKLENAFLYRKQRDAACTCKAPAWSPEARARHERYAQSAMPAPDEDEAKVVKVKAEPGKQHRETLPTAQSAARATMSTDDALEIALGGAFVEPAPEALVSTGLTANAEMRPTSATISSVIEAPATTPPAAQNSNSIETLINVPLPVAKPADATTVDGDAASGQHVASSRDIEKLLGDTAAPVQPLPTVVSFDDLMRAAGADTPQPMPLVPAKATPARARALEPSPPRRRARSTVEFGPAVIGGQR